MGWGRGWIGWMAACAVISGCGSWTLRQTGTAPTPAPPASSYAWEREGQFPPPAPVPAEPAHGAAQDRRDLPTHEIAPDAGLVNTDASFTVESLPPRRTATAVTPAAGAAASYRVQVFASRSREAAATMRDELAARFSAPALLEFEPPYFKVRVGACESEESCRALVEELRSAGYASAFTVPAQIAAP